ncbi:pre-mRNA 3'-end-processing factor FIP1 [Contarinia nasturtii]|uniref:pre-mRNA 3'-end-processing factor FIP1 n=1 Tax=Contarinia nasturtii TaxID=265458 RepID=UPI0012D49B39|nr:pre-mRNA 3'-end-processing factor FIP1 [Contarinia nasturtii]
MSEENNEDDSWLYGSSNENQENQEEQPQIDEKIITEDQSALAFSNDTTQDQDDSRNEEYQDDANEYNSQENSFIAENAVDTEKVNGNSDVNGSVSQKNENDDDDSDDDEDDIVVTIGDITPSSTFNIKQRSGNLLVPTSTAGQDKPKTNLGKFSIEEFESVGTISGQSAVEYNLEAIEDKPWRKPGADITDYFNYGFSEETWRAYCERQKRMRHESGAGLSGLGPNPTQTTPINNNPNRTLTSLTTSDNSKYSVPGTTNSHSGPPNFTNRGFNATPALAKENVIQVMTAERREYSRPKGKFDVSMSMPPPPFNMGNEQFYPDDTYSYGYEPTQEQQWNNDNVGVGWMPSGIKELTPGPQQMMPPPPMNMNMPPPNAMMPPNMMNVPQMVPPPQHNMSIGIGPMPPMMPPPVINNTTIPPNRGNEDHRNNQPMDKRNDSAPPSAWRRDKERDYRDREREEESTSDRERRRERERYRSDRDRGGSSRRDRSRSRERSSRRRSKSRSRERERKSRDKKKSHKKDKDDSE